MSRERVPCSVYEWCDGHELRDPIDPDDVHMMTIDTGFVYESGTPRVFTAQIDPLDGQRSFYMLGEGDWAINAEDIDKEINDEIAYLEACRGLMKGQLGRWDNS